MCAWLSQHELDMRLLMHVVDKAQSEVESRIWHENPSQMFCVGAMIIASST